MHTAALLRVFGRSNLIDTWASFPGFFRTLRTRTACPTTLNSASLSGRSPSFSLISAGMVTWPLEVKRIAKTTLMPKRVPYGFHSHWAGRAATGLR